MKKHLIITLLITGAFSGLQIKSAEKQIKKTKVEEETKAVYLGFPLTSTDPLEKKQIELLKVLSDQIPEDIRKKIIGKDYWEQVKGLTSFAEKSEKNLEIATNYLKTVIDTLERFGITSMYLSNKSHLLLNGIEKKEFNLFGARLLIESGADVNYPYFNETALIKAIQIENEDLVKLLLKYGANPNMEDVYGHSPLLWTLNNQDIKIAQLLLDHGVDPNTRRTKGDSLLGEAARQNKIDLAKLLLSNKKTDINLLNEIGQTPLIIAAQHNNIDIIKLLLERCADPTIKDNSGKSALKWAREKNNKEAAELLEKATAIFSPCIIF